jgi:hypothetical protein
MVGSFGGCRAGCSPLRRTWHIHFDTDAEELLAGVQVGMVAGPRCRTHAHAAVARSGYLLDDLLVGLLTGEGLELVGVM